MQNVYHHYSNSTHTPRHRLGSAACGQQNGSSRPTAARRCQRYTSCLSAVPEGLDLIDSLFDSVVTTNDKGSAEAPAHVLATISQPTDTPSTTVAPAKAKQHAQQTSTITAPPAANSQRSKLLQRLQKQRAKAGPTAVERSVPSPSTFTAPATSNSIRTQRSSVGNVKGDTLDDLVSLQQLLQNPVADVDDQSSSSSTRPSNPWLLRQQQQRKRQKQKQQQKEAAKYLAAQQQREQQQRQQEQQQQLQRQHLHAQLQQQQQQGPAADAVSNTSRARISTTRRVQLQHTPALQQTQQQHQESLPQQVDPHLQQDPNRGASVAASHHVQQPPKQQRQQQQPLLPQLQHQQQQVDIDLEGVVRSSRCRRPTSPLPQPPPPPAAAAAAAAAPPSSAPKPKAASASRSSEDSASHSAGQQQGRQQSGQQQAAAAAAAGTPVPPAQPATTHPAAAAAAGTASESVQVPDIGSMPLLITGGLAAGDSVVWTQPAQIQTTAADAPPPAAALSKQATGTQKRSSSSSSSSRYRRGARSLQGIATGPKPDLPLSTAAAAAPASMSDSVTAANVTSSSTRIRTDTINHSNSSTNSSLAAVDMMDLQEKLNGLTKHNWQQLAQQHLPDLYDPTWHSTFYTLALDVWAAALPIKAANKSSSSSNSSSVAAAWAVSSLYCPEQCMWCSTLLALLDTLADDADLSRVEPAVQLLPAAVLRNVVLPAARLLDDELHQELLQADKRLGSSMSSRSSTPVTATKPLISPAPWLQEQQQQQQQDNEGKSNNSSSSSSTPMVVTNASQDISVRLGSSGKTLPPPPPAASGADSDVPPGAGCLLDTLLALQQLQGLYPGVELSALAHVAQLHGVWK